VGALVVFGGERGALVGVDPFHTDQHSLMFENFSLVTALAKEEERHALGPWSQKFGFRRGVVIKFHDVNSLGGKPDQSGHGSYAYLDGII
jgi:hypothetical protein